MIGVADWVYIKSVGMLQMIFKQLNLLALNTVSTFVKCQDVKIKSLLKRFSSAHITLYNILLFKGAIRDSEVILKIYVTDEFKLNWFMGFGFNGLLCTFCFTVLGMFCIGEFCIILKFNVMVYGNMKHI